MGIELKNIVAIVPMRHSSERVKGKNYRPFAGAPLYSHILKTLLQSKHLSKVYVDTDSNLLMDGVRKDYPDVDIIARPQELLGGDVPVNDILQYDVSKIDADIYLQTHSTNPLLRTETVDRAIEYFLENLEKYDSLFSVTSVQKRFWTAESTPLNHKPEQLLRTQDLKPIYEENSCLYIFTKESFTKCGRRIGPRSFMYEIKSHEACDIDDEMDLDIAEFLYLRERGLA